MLLLFFSERGKPKSVSWAGKRFLFARELTCPKGVPHDPQPVLGVTSADIQNGVLQNLCWFYRERSYSESVLSASCVSLSARHFSITHLERHPRSQSHVLVRVPLLPTNTEGLR